MKEKYEIKKDIKEQGTISYLREVYLIIFDIIDEEFSYDEYMLTSIKKSKDNSLCFVVANKRDNTKSLIFIVKDNFIYSFNQLSSEEQLKYTNAFIDSDETPKPIVTLIEEDVIEVNLYTLRKEDILGRESYVDDMLKDDEFDMDDYSDFVEDEVKENPYVTREKERLMEIRRIREITNKLVFVYKDILKQLFNDYDIEDSDVSLTNIDTYDLNDHNSYLFSLKFKNTKDTSEISWWIYDEKYYPTVSPISSDDFYDFIGTKTFNTDLKVFNNIKLLESDKKRSLSYVMNKINKIRQELKKEVFGQGAAIDKLLSGLFDVLLFDNSNSSTKASFLFAGPSGTGKTTLANSLAKALNMNTLVVNMAEYSDKDALVRFKGFDKTFRNSRPGLVTSFIDSNPNTVIIFDEIDKAHIDIKNLLLQLYNDGYINDPTLEKNVSFKNTILVYTTNAGKKLYEENEGNLSLLSNKKILNALKKETDYRGEPIFPSALVSRFGAGTIVVFNNLEPYTLFSITKNAFLKKANTFTEGGYPKVEFSDDLITSLLYRLGGKADGRNLVGLAKKFFEDEIVDALRHLDKKELDSLKEIKFVVDKTNVSDYYSSSKLNVLVFSAESKFELLDTKIRGVKFYLASDLAKAKEILRKDIDFILCDVFTNQKIKNIYEDIEDIESDGRELITYCSVFFREIPLYILNYDLDIKDFHSFFKLGVKDTINTKDFKKNFNLIKEKVAIAKSCYKLISENKLLNYRSRQKKNNDILEIEMYNLNFKVEYNAVDDEEFLLDIDRPEVKFDDIIGSEDAKDTLRDFIDYLNNPRKYLDNGTRAPRGILLYGPPGTGKTMLAKAIAGESTFSFIQKNASDFVGKSADLIGDLFAKARKYAPSIIFLDEVDAIAKERVGYSFNDHILNKLLSELDGFKFDIKHPVIVICATNFPIEKTNTNTVVLDPAFVRRFDRKIKIDLPNKKERIEFINYYLNKHSIKTISEECILNIAKRTVYYTPAALEHLIEHALRNAKGNELTDEILENTVDENRYGKENKINEEDSYRSAIHEAGHAFISYLSSKMPTYLTITSRGNYGGYMMSSDDTEKMYLTKEDLLAQIRIALAGRAAEIIEFGDKDGLTTGPSDDLLQATQVAKAIICEYGMNNSLVSYRTLNYTSEELISEINKILDKEFLNAKNLILQNKKTYDKLVKELYEKNSLTEAEIKKILK